MLAPPQYCYSIIMLINWNYCYPSDHNQTRTIGAIVARFYVLQKWLNLMDSLRRIGNFWGLIIFLMSRLLLCRRYQSKLSSMSINLTREGVLNLWWMRGSGLSRLALLIIQILIGNKHNRVTSLQSQCILKILETYAEGSYIWEFAVVPASMPSGPKGQIFPCWVVPWFLANKMHHD